MHRLVLRATRDRFERTVCDMVDPAVQNGEIAFVSGFGPEGWTFESLEGHCRIRGFAAKLRLAGHRSRRLLASARRKAPRTAGPRSGTSNPSRRAMIPWFPSNLPAAAPVWV